MRVYIYLLKCRQSLNVQTHYDAGKNLRQWLYWIWTAVSKQTERCEACYTHRRLIDSQFPGVQSLLKLLIMQISERNV